MPQIMQTHPRHPSFFPDAIARMADMGVLHFRIRVDKHEVIFSLRADLIQRILRGIEQRHHPGFAALGIFSRKMQMRAPALAG